MGGADGGGEVATAGSGVVFSECGQDGVFGQVELGGEECIQEGGEAVECDGVELAVLLV